MGLRQAAVDTRFHTKPLTFFFTRLDTSYMKDLYKEFKT